MDYKEFHLKLKKKTYSAANRYDADAVIEYEITKVLYSLLNLKKPKVGVMTSLSMFGGYNFTKNEPTPEWAIIQKIKPSMWLIDKKTKLESFPKKDSMGK